MTKERMLELALLNQLFLILEEKNVQDYNTFIKKYDVKKMHERSQQLLDDFLSDYVKDTSE